MHALGCMYFAAWSPLWIDGYVTLGGDVMPKPQPWESRKPFAGVFPFSLCLTLFVEKTNSPKSHVQSPRTNYSCETLKQKLYWIINIHYQIKQLVFLEYI